MKLKSLSLAPALLALVVFGAFTGYGFSFVRGAFFSASAAPHVAPIEAYPHLDDAKIEGIQQLFDPQLPFNETVSVDAFLDRAGLSSAAVSAAFTAPVVKTGTAPGKVFMQPSGYNQPASAGSVTSPAPASAPVDATAARSEVLRKSGKLGTRDEASLYSWREVQPLGIVGFTEMREVSLMCLFNRSRFVARKNTRFADAVLVNVTPEAVVFRDFNNALHEVNWLRSPSGNRSSPESMVNPDASAPPRRAQDAPVPSGYAVDASRASTPSTATPRRTRRSGASALP